jgi:asparagine synthase (glutamine-hydrolysing)
MIWHLDDPIGDPITAPNFELAARVASDAAWVFNGEGGDPVFGGPKNLPMLLHHWYGGVPRGPRFRESMYLASYRRCFDDLDRILTPHWREQFDPIHELHQVLTPFFQAEQPSAFVDKLMAINIRLKGAHLILPKVDRMTGAWGLRQLAPLFDERLVDMSFRLPPRLKLNHGVEKIILKLAYRRDLPPEIIARPKSGMRVPVHFWFKGELKKYARKILSPANIKRAGIFNPSRVRQLLDYRTEEGPGRYGLRLWMLITFEIWRRIVVEGEAP